LYFTAAQASARACAATLVRRLTDDEGNFRSEKKSAMEQF